MANTGELQKRVKDLTIAEDDLWQAFKKAEEEYSIPGLNIWKAHCIAKPLLQRKLLKPTNYYPFFAVAVLLVAIITVINNYFLILYLITVFFATRSFNKYKDAATKDMLKNSNFVLNGFGISNLSLIVFGILNILKLDGKKINKEDISSILKIVKSRHENEDVSFGFADNIKKLIYASFLTFPIWIISNIKEMESYSIQAIAIFQNNILVTIYLTYMACLSLWIGYEIVFVQTKRKKKQKKYLLLLNIIHESWI